MSNFPNQANNGGMPEGAANLNGSSIGGNFPPPPAMSEGGGEAAKTLWMAEPETRMHKNLIEKIFSTVAGETVNVKVVRDRNSDNAGYCFVESSTSEAATKALALNGTPVPNSGRVFKLNWASGRTAGMLGSGRGNNSIQCTHYYDIDSCNSPFIFDSFDQPVRRLC